MKSINSNSLLKVEYKRIYEYYVNSGCDLQRLYRQEKRIN
jgi:hypothetical protein